MADSIANPNIVSKFVLRLMYTPFMNSSNCTPVLTRTCGLNQARKDTPGHMTMAIHGS